MSSAALSLYSQPNIFGNVEIRGLCWPR